MQPRRDDTSQDLHRTLSPTLLIGLGGTGTETLLRVRRSFFERYGTTGFPIIGYLALDTDPNQFRKLIGEPSELVLRNIQFREQADIPEAINCSITQQQFEQYFRGGLPQHPHIFRWMPKHMEEYGSSSIVEGAGQNRPFGRLAFFHHFESIRRALDARIAHIVKEALPAGQKKWLPPDAEVEHNRLDVVLVYSVAGGTGAGMFLDLGMLVRHLVHANNNLMGVQPRFTHYAVLPDTYMGEKGLSEQQKTKIRENAFTCLREMEYFSRKHEEHLRTGRIEAFDLSIPPPVRRPDQEPPRREPLYRARWGNHEPEVEIHNTPWDICYLVGGNNNSMNTAYLSAPLIRQMLAERLLLDFDPSRFAQLRRPMDSNLAGDMLSKMEIEVPDEHGKPLYSYWVNRRFSIFGQSQIYFDRTRMRRSASFLLARMLVDYWMRPSSLSPALVNQFAREDLFGTGPAGAQVVTPTGEKGDPLLPLGYDALLGEMLLKKRGHDRSSYWSTLDAQAAELRRRIEDGLVDPQSERVLNELLEEHRSPLDRPPVGDPGEALRTYRRNREQLVGAAEERLRCLFLYRVKQLGLPGAFQLFKEYGTLLEKELRRAQENVRKAPNLGSEWAERVREARRVPWPLKDPATRIELLRGLTAIHRHVAAEYHHKAIPEIRACLERSYRCVSLTEGQQGSYTSLLGRLSDALKPDKSAGRDVRGLLQMSFDHLGQRRPDDKDSRTHGTQEIKQETRTVGLLPRWEEKEYEREIRRVIPQDNAEENVDWRSVEKRVLEELRRSGSAAWADVTDLSDVALRFVRLDHAEPVSQNTVEELARDLAEACEAVLSNFARNISALTIFLEQEPVKRDNDMVILRQYSGAFLRKSGDVTLPDDHDKASVVLLGLADSQNQSAQKFRATLIETGGKNDAALRHLKSFDHQDDALILYQERVGIPLCYYAELDALGDLYDRSNRKRETYFDYDAFKGGRLPEIRKLSHRREMAESVEPILLSIMTGILKYEEGSFQLVERRAYGPSKHPMGKRLEDVIKECSDDPLHLKEIHEQFKAWRSRAAQAGGEKLAILWCAALDFKEHIRQRIEAHRKSEIHADSGPRGDHPLLSIVGGKMMENLKKWVRGVGEAGERWLGPPLDLDAILQDRALEDEQRDELLVERTALLEGCYELLDPDLIPIPILKPDAKLNKGLTLEGGRSAV